MTVQFRILIGPIDFQCSIVHVILEMLIIALTLTLPLKTIYTSASMPARTEMQVEACAMSAIR